LSADAGFLTNDTTHLNSHFWDRFWRDAGYSFTLVFAWPVWDFGAARARIAQANLGLQQARLQLEVEKRDARLAWEKARTARDRLYAQIALLSRAVPEAEDSYLQAESRYRGGTASALDVLEAHAAAVDAAVRRSDAVARYRVAEAALLRWGTP
ncbi:MAG TPA: TolC family protein, partial [Thermoanaerobaculia bacterium]